MSSRFRGCAWVVATALLLAAGLARAADAPADADKDRQIKELQAQVQRLEARLAALEKKLGVAGGAEAAVQPAAARGAPAQPAAAGAGGEVTPIQRQKLAEKARQRMRQDTAKYSRQQLTEAEELYQVANKNWRTPEAKQSLEQMVKKYPNVNRTGCAVLYLAQYSAGEERERLLKEAIEKYGDCYYGNGVQVGAFARFLLGLDYQSNGQADKAKELFEEIRKKYPDAITHRGESLVAKLPAE